MLYVADAGGERVLMDPVAIDPSGRTTLDHWQPDKEGRLLAYQLSSGGNEESLLRVLDVASGEVVDGPIDRCRYSGVAWLPGGKASTTCGGCRRRRCPTGRASITGGCTCMSGTARSRTRSYSARAGKTTYYGVSVSLDGRWLLSRLHRHRAPQ